MKKFSIFITILLVILIASIVFVLQNNATVVSLKFFGWTFPAVSVGLLTIVAFFAGFVVMWLISLMLYFGSVSRYKKEIKSRDKLIKQLEEEKNTLNSEIEKLKKEIIEKDAELKRLNENIEKSKAESNEIKHSQEKAVENASNKESNDIKNSENNVKDTEEKPKRRGIFRRR
ncbi:MAG: DUF1049 domain-containing protein [Caldisericaceae bacterium]|nr:DUF1049 domain-containing protein [Caldisericaceae bacterium]